MQVVQVLIGTINLCMYNKNSIIMLKDDKNGKNDCNQFSTLCKAFIFQFKFLKAHKHTHKKKQKDKNTTVNDDHVYIYEYV